MEPFPAWNGCAQEAQDTATPSYDERAEDDKVCYAAFFDSQQKHIIEFIYPKGR